MSIVHQGVTNWKPQNSQGPHLLPAIAQSYLSESPFNARLASLTEVAV